MCDVRIYSSHLRELLILGLGFHWDAGEASLRHSIIRLRSPYSLTPI